MTDLIPPHSEMQPEPESTVILPTSTHEPAHKNDDTILVSRTTLNYMIIAVTFFVVGIVIGAVSFGNLNTMDETAVEGVVRSLMEDAELLRPLQDMTRLVDDDPYLGQVDAPVVIVEFSAYACPYCARHFNQTFEPLLENYGQYIRYVYRDFPSVNPDVSYAAAVAANCAREQDRFWDYHALLFQNQNLLGSAYFSEAASDLEMDVEAFQECYQSQAYLAEVEDDFQAGLAVGISGTPSFYINGKFYSGARPYAFFEDIVLRELDAAGIDYKS